MDTVKGTEPEPAEQTCDGFTSYSQAVGDLSSSRWQGELQQLPERFIT
jgi:hypothetical protein